MPNHPLKIIPKCPPRICTLCKNVTLPNVSESWRDILKTVKSRLCHKKGRSEKHLSSSCPISPMARRVPSDPDFAEITPTSQDHLSRSPPSPLLPTEPTFLHLSKYVRRPFCSRLYLLRANNWPACFVHCLGFGTFLGKSLQLWNYSMLTIK